MKNHIIYLVACLFVCSLGNAQITPYLQSPTPTSVWVCWKTSSGEETTVTYGSDSTNLNHSISGTAKIYADNGYNNNYYWHSAQLMGLQPNTRYYYQAKTGSTLSPKFHFRTIPDKGQGLSDGHIRFISVGDNQVADARYDTLICQAKWYCENKFKKPLADCINFVVTCGDQVDKGTLSDYEKYHLGRFKYISPYIPVNTLVGNHETYGSMGLTAYDAHFSYKNTYSYKGINSGTNYYYAFQAGNMLMLMLSSEHPGKVQKEWAYNVIDSAIVDPTVEWICFEAHRPVQAEQYVGDISTWVKDEILSKLQTTNKTALFIGGHHHLYARGQVKDFSIYHIISGGASWDQYWGMGTEQDMDDVQKTISNWPWVLVDFDLANKKMTVEALTNGSKYTYKNNELIDSFHRIKGLAKPSKPSVTNIITDTITLPYTFSSSGFETTSGELLNSTWFQVSRTPVFSTIEKDVIRDYENLYGSAGTPDLSLDVNKNINILQWQPTKNTISNGKHYIRVRHRDRNLEWSDWSEPIEFLVKGSSSATSISLNKTEYQTNDDIVVSYVNTSGNPKDWIGLYKVGQTPGNENSAKWSYISGNSGEVSFKLSESGKLFFAGLFLNDKFQETCPRQTFYVGPVPVLSCNKSKYNTGDNVVVSFKNAPGNSSDSIKIYKAGKNPGEDKALVAKKVIGTSGSLSIEGLGKNYYFAAYMLENNTAGLGQYVSFQLGDTIANISTNKAVYGVGEKIMVNFNSAPGNPKDWMGIYKQGIDPQNGDLEKFKYVDGLSEGTIVFKDTLPEGDYFIALFSSDSYNEISKEVKFSVSSEITGANVLKNDPGIQIYPNPVCDRLKIQTENKVKSVSICNLFGEEVYKLNKESRDYLIDMSNFQNGLYFLKITENNFYTGTYKIMKIYEQ